jgi:hypothetical protein
MTKNFNVFVEDNNGDEYKLSLLDMARFHWTLTKASKEGTFSQFQYLGKLSGEGQSGGRWIHDLAHALEDAIVDRIGKKSYQKFVDNYIQEQIKLWEQDRDYVNPMPKIQM